MISFFSPFQKMYLLEALYQVPRAETRLKRVESISLDLVSVFKRAGRIPDWGRRSRRIRFDPGSSWRACRWASGPASRTWTACRSCWRPCGVSARRRNNRRRLRQARGHPSRTAGREEDGRWRGAKSDRERRGRQRKENIKERKKEKEKKKHMYID